jgi:RHH-type transcriptional regulator, rel operon repressor / antitoxin RelB
MKTASEPTTTITIRVPERMREQFDALAKTTGRTRQYLALEGLRRYLETESWQIAKIMEGIRAADAGEFAEDDEVERVLTKYSAHRMDRVS